VCAGRADQLRRRQRLHGRRVRRQGRLRPRRHSGRLRRRQPVHGTGRLHRRALQGRGRSVRRRQRLHQGQLRSQGWLCAHRGRQAVRRRQRVHRRQLRQGQGLHQGQQQQGLRCRRPVLGGRRLRCRRVQGRNARNALRIQDTVQRCHGSGVRAARRRKRDVRRQQHERCRCDCGQTRAGRRVHARQKLGRRPAFDAVCRRAVGQRRRVGRLHNGQHGRRRRRLAAAHLGRWR